MEMIKTELIEIGIIHLSDIHFSTKTDYVTNKFNLFFNALKDDFQNCNHIYVVVSGDIANEGSAFEYEKALTFFGDLSKGLKERYISTKIRFIFVPGNHDCNFLLDSRLRQNTIQNISYDTLGDDNSVLDACIGIQADFGISSINMRKYQKIKHSTG